MMYASHMHKLMDKHDSDMSAKKKQEAAIKGLEDAGAIAGTAKGVVGGAQEGKEKAIGAKRVPLPHPSVGKPLNVKKIPLSNVEAHQHTAFACDLVADGLCPEEEGLLPSGSDSALYAHVRNVVLNMYRGDVGQYLEQLSAISVFETAEERAYALAAWTFLTRWGTSTSGCLRRCISGWGPSRRPRGRWWLSARDAQASHARDSCGRKDTRCWLSRGGTGPGDEFTRRHCSDPGHGGWMPRAGRAGPREPTTGQGVRRKTKEAGGIPGSSTNPRWSGPSRTWADRY